MTAEEFYRKRLIELTPKGIMQRVNKVVDINTQAQICQEYHEYKLKLLGIGDVSNSVYCECKEKEVLMLPHSNTPYCAECGKNIKQ